MYCILLYVYISYGHTLLCNSQQLIYPIHWDFHLILFFISAIFPYSLICETFIKRYWMMMIEQNSFRSLVELSKHLQLHILRFLLHQVNDIRRIYYLVLIRQIFVNIIYIQWRFIETIRNLYFLHLMQIRRCIYILSIIICRVIIINICLFFFSSNFSIYFSVLGILQILI